MEFLNKQPSNDENNINTPIISNYHQQHTNHRGVKDHQNIQYYITAKSTPGYISNGQQTVGFTYVHPKTLNFHNLTPRTLPNPSSNERSFPSNSTL